MPQASDDLSRKFEDDREAFKVLGDTGTTHFVSERFTLINYCFRPKAGIKPTPEELEAIDYLFQEWDYGYQI